MKQIALSEIKDDLSKYLRLAEAAFCLQGQEPPRQILRNKKLLADFQKRLQADGVELEWPRINPR